MLLPPHKEPSKEMKHKNRSIFLVFFITALAVFLTGCSQESTSDAASAIKAYIEALVSQDEALLVNASCADWEDDAILELDSLSAVSVSLENLNCTEAAQEGETTLVACTGNLIADYNGEEQEIDLSERAYAAIQEGGEWRMCGYR
jgi:hypothetical protein